MKYWYIFWMLIWGGLSLFTFYIILRLGVDIIRLISFILYIILFFNNLLWLRDLKKIEEEKEIQESIKNIGKK